MPGRVSLLMRAAVLGVLGLVALGHAQTSEPAFKPDVTIVVREHSIGADMFEITMSRSDYPADLLRSQVSEMGRLLSSPPRGLAIGEVKLDPANPSLTFLKARFAVDGVIDRPGGVLRLEPVLKAFAGAPEPYTVHGLLILFDGERPNPSTVKSHRSDSVEGEGTFTASPPLIEYRVRLKSQDPSKIAFPEKVPEQRPVQNPSDEKTGTPVLFWSAVVVAGLAAGALVYLALLRGGAGSQVRRK